MQKKTVVCDADNTLWPQMEWSVLAIESVLDYLSLATLLSHEEIETRFRLFFAKNDSPDAGTAFIRNSQITKDRRIIAHAEHLYQSIRDKHLHSYEGVKRTLCELNKLGHRIIIITDAPIERAVERLLTTGLGKYVHVLVGRIFSGAAKAWKTVLGMSKYLPFKVVGTNVSKPNTPVGEILGLADAEIATGAVFIGDSCRSDMALASKYNARGFLAEWGIPDGLRELKMRLGKFVEIHDLPPHGVKWQNLPEGCIPLGSFREILRYI